MPEHTLTDPQIVMAFVSGMRIMSRMVGLIRIGVMTSVSRVPRGTVLSMRSSRLWHVEAKNSGEVAIFPIKLPPSALNIRKSERVVTLGPKANTFCVELDTNSLALER